MSSNPSQAQSAAFIDPRGPRFGAVITTVVLAVVLLTSNGWLLAVQTVIFALGAFSGLKYAPYGYLYRKLIRPRLAKPTELENPAPPTFAQGVGFAFAAVGTLGYLSGVTALGLVFTGFALAAAFLNAAFDFCLGCEVYLLIRRGAPRREPVGS
ncbi:MAG TPA: DUF4395 domain-containing protein [Actinocrinis sp.]|uniref:DUF4395 domain-containing protein n=1 Tax=Actinocrinis sp. TaxID=1920516 RepID=UPI002D5F81EE|nr:DUF4395 domain-containing protein [Actinocrinis sp.]HZU57611.1 DUF4395 domain-containing protein [Actinocrinis sp.]